MSSITYVTSGQTLTGASFGSGTALLEYPGGLVQTITIAGGTASLFGAAGATMLRAGGIEYVFTGATEANDTIGAGGVQILQADGPPGTILETVQGGTGNPAQSILFSSRDQLSFIGSVAAAINAQPAADVYAVLASGADTVPAAATAVVVNAPGPVTLVGGGAQTVIGGSGGLTYFGAASVNLDLAVAGGMNTIFAGTGATYDIDVGGAGNSEVFTDGSGTVYGGTGANTIDAAGGSRSVIVADGNGDQLIASAGNATIDENGSNALIFAASGNDIIADDGTHDTVVGGNGSATIFGSGNGVYYLGDGSTQFIGMANGTQAGDTITGQSGSETVFGGVNDVIEVGSSTLALVANAGNETVVQSSGDVMIYGQSGANVDLFNSYVSAQPVVAVEGPGAETIDGAADAGAIEFFAGSGNALFIGGSQTGNYYVFSKSYTYNGPDTIVGFKNSDQVILSGYGSNEVAVALATAKTTSAGTTITLGDGTQVLFEGVSSLSSGRFSGDAVRAGAGGAVNDSQFISDDDLAAPAAVPPAPAATSAGAVVSGPSATATLIQAGGEQQVGGTATVTGTTIAGGTLLLEPGGTANGTTIMGGLMSVQSGASLMGGVRFFGAPGTLAASLATVDAGSVTGFGYGDTIDITNLAYNASVTATLNQAGTVLNIDDAGRFYMIPLGAMPGELVTTRADPAGTGTDFTGTPPCYAAGTHILTPRGEVAVEHLKPGDQVVTVRDGGAAVATIIWAGHRTIDIGRHKQPDLVRPIRVQAGAFGSYLPQRDLRLSPHHAVYVEGVLIEIMRLVNGTTIAPEAGARHVTYHHIELTAHDIMLAEGLPAESYLDTGNRNMFAGQDGAMPLHPSFQSPPAAPFCVPMIREGEVLERVRSRLKARAERVDQDRPGLPVRGFMAR